MASTILPFSQSNLNVIACETFQERCGHALLMVNRLACPFQDCRKLSEDVQSAVIAVATVYYWLPKGQGEIVTGGQSPLYRVVILSPLHKETQRLM